MAQKIELSNEPSQNFTVNLNEHNFEITIKDVGGVCLMGIVADGENLGDSWICFANQPVIAYAYLSKLGNFVFIGPTNDYPAWETFNTMSTLYYLTPKEIADAAAS